VILINDLINAIPLTLISWPSAPFLVIQVEETLCKLSIMNRSSPQLIIHVVYTLLSINSLNLLMNVSWRHVFCSLVSFQAVSSVLTYIIFAIFTSKIQSHLAAEV